jgi:MFS family permease
MPEPTSPLQIPDFRLTWLSRFTSTFATIGMVVIIGYQLYDLARSEYGMSIPEAALQLGLLGLAQFLPLMLLTPVAGVVADRFDRRMVAGLASLLDMLIALSLAITTQMDLLSLPMLYGMAALHGIARVFIGPAMSTFIPNIVPAALMPRAVALGSLSWQVGQIGGPALAGVLFAVRPDAPYWFAAALLAISCATIFAIRRMPPPEGNREAHPLRQIADGFAFVWNERFLLGCVTLDLFAVLLGGATALLPVFARDILTYGGEPVGAHGLGLMRAMPAVGAVVIGVLLSARPITRNVGAKMLWSVVVFGAATAVFGLSRNFALSLAALVLLGAADMVSVFIRSTLIQLNTPDAMRGRVSAITNMAVSASNELGEMQSGLAAALLGATGAVVFGGVGAIVITGLWAWIFPELIRARTFAPHYREAHRQKEPAP